MTAGGSVTDTTHERRHQPRPAPHAPNWNLRLENRIAQLWHGIRAPVRDIALLWLLTLGTLGWALWTVNVRLDPLHGWFNSVQNEISLRNELARYEKSWSPDAPLRVHQEIDTARRRILLGYPELSAWLYRLAEDARPAGIAINYLIGPPEPLAEASDLIAIPLLFTFKLDEAGAANHGYNQLLHRLAVILDAPWALELRAAAIDGTDGHAQSMTLTIHMWMSKQQQNAVALAANQTALDASLASVR